MMDLRDVRHLVRVYCYMGKKSEAIAQLQRLYEGHDERLLWIKVYPYLDPLRDDPSFKDILRKMKLSE